MAVIYGTPLFLSGGGGQNLTLPPMVTNLAAVAGNQEITVSYTNPESDALAGVLVVYKTGSYPTKPTDGAKLDAGLAESVKLEGLENGTDYYIRVFPYNAKKQYQTLIDGATTTARPSEGPKQVTDLKVTGSGANPVLTWKNPTDDPTYHETVVVQKVDSAPTSLSDGTEIYRGTGETVSANGLERLKNYYWGVFTVNAEGGTRGPIVTEVYSFDFPEEPSEYLPCDELTNSNEYQFPEDGWFKMIAISAGGNGGLADLRTNQLTSANGAGGGSGAIAVSIFKQNKNDTCSMVFENGKITINNHEETIIVTPGTTPNKSNVSSSITDYGGNGGTSAGGNIENVNGVNGSPANKPLKWSDYSGLRVSGSAGGKVSYESYKSTGGTGEGLRVKSSASGSPNGWLSTTPNTNGTQAKVVILRGNTNTPLPSQVSVLSLIPHNGEIEANWKNSGDPEQVGTTVVVNQERVPETPEDGEAVDVMQAESYIASGLKNGKPCYIGLFAYNADKTKYSAVKADVEIPREVTWYDAHQELKQEVQQAEQEATEQAEQAQEAVTMTRDFLPDAIALTMPQIYDEWDPNSKEYIGKDKATPEKPAAIVRRNEKLYRCLQSHTSQENWKPETSPSLWVEIADPALEWPEWKQPTGAHDAYDLNAKVSHNGKKWISQIAANTVEPGTDDRYWKECSE